MTESDPVLEQRARIGRITAASKRFGYSLFAIACVLFVFGFVVGFRQAIVTPIVVCLVVGSIVLAPAIVLAYGVQAANREDAGGGSFH